MASLHIPKFRRKFALSLTEYNTMKRRGIIRIVQSGYRGHALCHPKVVEYEPQKVQAWLDIQRQPMKFTTASLVRKRPLKNPEAYEKAYRNRLDKQLAALQTEYFRSHPDGVEIPS